MKPDGVATTPAEPPEDVVEPVPEAAANEELVQQDPSPSSTQPENDENQGKQEGAPSTLPPPGKEVNGKFSKPKDKTKAPVKTKPGTAGIKSTTTAGAASRFATAESRAANGVKKTASVGVNKKPASMTSELKKSAPVGASSQVKKVPTATTVASRTQVKVAEQKAVGSARPISSTSSVTRKPAAATSQALSNKSAVGGSNVPVKPKTAAPKTTSAPAAKTSIPDGSKAAATSKTTRSTVATASRTAPSSAPVRLKTATNKSTALRTTVSATKSASAQPTTVAAKKDITTTNSSAARKLLSSTTTRSPAPKATKPEPPKPTAAAKRLPTDPKTFPQKMIKAQVPTRKVPPSPRNISSRTASGRLAAELGNHKQGVSSNLVSATVQTAKPTQSVLPLVIKGKPSEEQSLGSVEPSAVIETTATIAPVESVIEAQALEEGQAEVPAQDPTNVDTVSLRETRDAEPFTTQSVANELVPCEMVHDYVIVVAPTAQEMNGQERATTSPCEVPVTLQMPPRDLEVVEKQELIIRNFEEEEEEKEGSQQVSVSDMSGTQPTEESRPGSAGLAGSLYRAGGLPSEFDSEDVSCSQHGASELSAPGVLEGTESMDDLGEASLKGADEGASAGSPDFEKFPDILVNEDVDEDDDEDRVDDMDVGSEMTEDPHRQYNDDEDEDVEMASEGVTESGLESYGNADEDDLTEDYRLDNLNRMQPLSIVSALSSADAWMQSLQPDPALVSSPASFPWQTNPELPATEAFLDIEGAKTDLSSQTSAVISFPSLEPAAEVGMDHKQGPCLPCMSQASALLDPELTDYAHRSDLCVEQEKGATKQHSGLRVDHVMRLPTELPPRMPKVGCNAQLRRLEQHQQQLAEIEQRREQQKLIPEKQKVEKEMKCNGKNGEREQEIESELKSREEKDGEFEEQRRHLLQLQIQQQQQELKQRQQIMQWQQELEQQTEQSKHQNSHPKNLSTVPLSPSGLCTIYEALETSDAEEENEDNEREMVLKIKVEHVGSSEERSGISEAHTSLENPDTLQSQCTPPFSNYADDQNRFTHPVTTDGPPLSETSTTPTRSHSLDWSKKTDIVQQLINQTLLLNGDKCSPHLLIPDGAAGTLSPLKTSLWPNLPQMTPLSATVTSVSSYSAELSGSSPQGEWTVVELETHH
ncbi:hypothetical protein Baya_1309 [Bagarius yarrelli]|uniref:BTB/POZ domain-containing protein n=1 Tax=Bagarius yarrelli TaxID=175774 RepID=A0A556TKQ5_BAGYA|nr:hypothetical protein Baya_1309 [Bagarius yarrelli]